MVVVVAERNVVAECGDANDDDTAKSKVFKIAVAVVPAIIDSSCSLIGFCCLRVADGALLSIWYLKWLK